VTKGRWLGVVVGLILATMATVGVLLFSWGVQELPKTGGLMVSVVVSKVDIPAGTDLDPLIKDHQFQILQIPSDAVVDGAVAAIDVLKGKTTSAAILAHEQIPFARINGV
jgi:Flp pilus assembly protein CpaB